MEFYRAAHFQETPVGRFPKDWNIKKIGDISRIVTGGTPSTKHPEYFDGNIKWLKSGDIKGLYIYDTEEKITELGIENSNAKIHPPNSVAIALSGRGQTRGRTAITKTPMSCSQSVAFMIPNEEIVPEYLHYNLSNRYIEIRNLTGDLDRSGLNLSIVSRISVPFPPLNEQHGIVEVLSCVDLAIQKTDEVIAKTERLKKGLMQKLLTEGIGHKEFKDTEIGKIPQKWEFLKIGELLNRGIILEIQDGNHGELHPKSSDFVEKGVPFVTASDIKNGKLDLENCKFITKEKAESLRVGFSKNGDVLLTHKGSMGLVAMVTDLRTTYVVLSPQVTYYRTDPNRLCKDYLYYAFQEEHFQRTMKQTAKQSTRDYISILNQRRLQIVLPDQVSEQRRIASFISGADSKLELERKQKAKLERIKQGLMDLLLSGKVRVKVD